MSEQARFPWKVAVTGGGLLVLALLTVALRADVVAEGHALLQVEHQRAALQRRERDLQIRLQQQWQELGRQHAAPAARGGSRS